MELSNSAEPRRVISTDRADLRELGAGDVEGVMQIFSDPEAMRYAPIAPTVDRAAAERFIEWNQQNYRGHGCGAYAVIERASGRYIGHAGIIPHEIGAEVFYALVRECWGRGLATEIACACRDYALGPLGRERLIAIIHPENAAAAAVAMKAGLREAGQITFWNRPNRLFELNRR